MRQTIYDEACAKCGYDLTGLARSGTCPECGQAFDADRGVGLVRPGLAGHHRAERWLGRLSAWGFVFLAVMVLGCAGLMQVLASVGRPKTLWAMAGITAGVLLLAAANSAITPRD